MKREAMGMTWDVHEPTRGRGFAFPCITISRNDTRLYLNLPGWTLAGKPEAVELLFNRAHRSIALSPTSPDNPAAAMLNVKHGGAGRQISAATLIRTIDDMGYVLPLAIPVHWDSSAKLLWGELSSGVHPSRARRPIRSRRRDNSGGGE